jgi:hypothetical protein
MKLKTPVLICIFFMCIVVVLAGCSTGGSEGLEPLVIDDFEDGDLDNLLNHWTASGGIGSPDTFAALSTPPGEGSYAMQLTTDMETVTGSGLLYYGSLFLHTGATSGATPVDVSEYTKLEFGLSFSGSFAPGPDPGAHPEIEVRVGGGSNAIRYDLLGDFDLTFKDYSISLADFVVTSGNLAGLKSAVEQVTFQVYIWGDDNDSMTFSLIIDDVQFAR